MSDTLVRLTTQELTPRFLSRTRSAMPIGVDVRGGYRLPRGKSLYVAPGVGTGYNFDGDDVVIAPEKFERAPISVFPTVPVFAMCRAKYAASRPNQPIRPEPRVCIQASPRKIEAGVRRHPTSMDRVPPAVEHRQLDPAEIGPESGRPNDRGGFHALALFGVHGCSHGCRHPAEQLHAVPPGDHPGPIADQEFPIPDPMPERGVRADIHHPKRFQPPEEAATRHPRGQPGQPLADGQVGAAVRATSAAICTPELPAPTTRISPSGSAAGLQYRLLWSCSVSSGSRSAIGGKFKELGSEIYLTEEQVPASTGD